jgi:hypothetical protein
VRHYLRMDKSRRKELKKQFKEGQKDSDKALQFCSKVDQQIVQTDRVSVERFGEWEDEQIEQNIIYYVYNRFKNEGKRPKKIPLAEWERMILQKLPTSVVAVYATSIFEQDLSVNGSYWDYFCQGDGVFAIEALNGYRLMGNAKMAAVTEQCIGAYLKLQKSGAVQEACGELYKWDIDEELFVRNNLKDFDELDHDYRAEGQDFINRLFRDRIRFIKENIELFDAGK